jgi:CheY-like chemotaxis protein
VLVPLPNTAEVQARKGSSKTILVVEDEEAPRLQGMLEDHRYRVTDGCRRRKGLEFTRHHREIDLIVTDCSCRAAATGDVRNGEINPR